MQNLQLKIFKNAKWFIAVILIFLITLTVLLGRFTGGLIKDLSINLGAGFIGSFLTIFLFDFLKDKQKAILWEEAKGTATEELIRLTTMLASHILAPTGYTVLDRRINRNKDIRTQAICLLQKMVEDQLEGDLTSTLENMSTKDWRALEINLITVRSSMFEFIQLYKEIVPPELFGKLLTVRRYFETTYMMFGLAPELLTKEKEAWPDGRRNEELRKVILKSLATDLEKYFTELLELFEMLESTGLLELEDTQPDE